MTSTFEMPAARMARELPDLFMNPSHHLCKLKKRESTATKLSMSYPQVIISIWIMILLRNPVAGFGRHTRTALEQRMGDGADSVSPRKRRADAPWVKLTSFTKKDAHRNQIRAQLATYPQLR